MQTPSRLRKTEEIIELAMMFQNSYCGLCIDDIQEHFECSRRSAERMKALLFDLFPEKIEEDQLAAIVDYCMLNNVDGIEARSIAQISFINEMSNGRFPIIANCHIKSPSEAAELLQDGASLIELRSGMVYEGPSLVRKTLNYLEKADLK
mgnify:CR=1 FL=1